MRTRHLVFALLLTVAVGGCHCGGGYLEDSQVALKELVAPVALQGATTVQAAAFLTDDRALVSLIQDTDNDGLLTGADRCSIWSLDVDNERWTALTDPQTASSFLPDSGFAIGTRPFAGGRVFFHRVGGDSDGDGLLTTADAVELWSMLPDGSDARAVVSDGGPRLADVSDEAGLLIYSTRNLSLGRDFFLATLDGGSPVRIPIPGMASASFSPSGKQFAAAIDAPSGMSLELVDPADGYSRKNMLEGVSLLYFAPRWSQDGARVLGHVGGDADGDGRVALDEPGEIVAVNVVTGDIEQVTLSPIAGNCLGGVWGESGRVLYMSAAPSTSEHFRRIRLLAAPLGADRGKEIYCCFDSALKVFLAPSPNSRRFLVDLWSDANNDGRVDGADRSVLGLIEPR